ncbi:GspH/FimT family pseudopilin [Serpens gallinarum]|uniref:Type II secretion system protein H n=1 Tax=Serpens gallinarum TaxID=2763075 RepID=A0ABR8TPL9_9PSED|nr:GspH/FimT family pseudopilin [Serpens gallinarum]MBD7977702.1 GspH/FimT family pseudopilin [Serpens gallinarum]
MNLHPQRAFTLVELMITLALLAILASVAVPAFAELIARNRQLALQHEVLNALNFARAYAARNNTRVNFCASSNGTTCQNDWSTGWIIRLEADGRLLRQGQPGQGNFLAWEGGIARSITFHGNGTSNNGSFYQCHAQQMTWLILISRQGRARIGNTSDQQTRSHYCS